MLTGCLLGDDVDLVEGEGEGEGKGHVFEEGEGDGGHWLVWRRFKEGSLIRVIHTFNINPGFSETRPATFASMGPNFE